MKADQVSKLYEMPGGFSFYASPKPRLRLMEGLWYCTGQINWNRASTPFLAYSLWLADYCALQRIQA